MSSGPWGIEWAGRLEEVEIDSQVLRDNPLGDPHVRPLWVYLPPGYDSSPDRRYPAVYVIQGFTGQLDMWRNRAPFRLTYPELADRLFASGEAPPCLLVFADCWTSLGGSQFLDSPATGRYHTYLCDEVTAFVDGRYRTLAAPEHRGIQGKSSGGYGAMVTPMLRPDVFGALASHAGDALFEVCYPMEFGDVVRALRDDYGGSFEAWREELKTRPFGTKRHDHALLDSWAMAACYSADPDGAVQLPFDLETGRLRPEVWERWLRWDPVRMAPSRAEALRSLRAVYLDAGRRDEYYLDLGAAAFKRELDALGVRDVRFELFDAGHGGIEYRYPVALRYLAERLA
jgi:molybdopterin converting factor small subunit